VRAQQSADETLLTALATARLVHTKGGIMCFKFHVSVAVAFAVLIFNAVQAQAKTVQLECVSYALGPGDALKFYYSIDFDNKTIVEQTENGRNSAAIEISSNTIVWRMNYATSVVDFTLNRASLKLHTRTRMKSGHLWYDTRTCKRGAPPKNKI
jgi:hypothetical protein